MKHAYRFALTMIVAATALLPQMAHAQQNTGVPYHPPAPPLPSGYIYQDADGPGYMALEVTGAVLDGAEYFDVTLYQNGNQFTGKGQRLVYQNAVHMEFSLWDGSGYQDFEIAVDPTTDIGWGMYHARGSWINHGFRLSHAYPMGFRRMPGYPS